MPLTARHDDGRRIDSTDDDQWAEVHRSGYRGLFCPECRGVMHARDGFGQRIRCFAHNPGSSESCSLRQSESPEHLRVKSLIAQSVRSLTGWTADIEHPGDGWRADVLAISPGGDRRIAFEPQFSYIHADTARTRTARHGASGVETVWLDTRMRPNLEGLPRARLTYRDNDPRVSVAGFDARGWSATIEPWWNAIKRLTPGQFAQRVCLGVVTYADDGLWAADADRADMAQLCREAHAARKAREAEREAQAERARVEREAARGRAERADAQRVAQWELDRPRREAEAARWRAEDEARAVEAKACAEESRKRAALLQAEHDARTRQQRAEQEAERARTAAVQWELDRPRREAEAAREAAVRAEQARRAAEWPLERIRALMAEARGEEIR